MPYACLRLQRHFGRTPAPREGHPVSRCEVACRADACASVERVQRRGEEPACPCVGREVLPHSLDAVGVLRVLRRTLSGLGGCEDFLCDERREELRRQC